MIRRIAAFVLAAVILVPVGAHAIDIRRVVSDKGIVAWFVPDKSVPVVALSFAFRDAGAATDPAGKEGIAEMVTGLLDEGAGDLPSQDYQRAVEEIAAQISFDAGRDHFFGRLRTLSAERDRAFELMRVAINAPRFDAKPVERVRGQILAGLQQQAESPRRISGDAWRNIVFAGHPYARPTEGTAESVSGITVADLRAFVSERFSRDRLIVGVVGDISEAELRTRLDELFGALPAAGKRFAISEIAPKGAGITKVIEKQIPQSLIVLGHAGIKRSSPDWYAATLVTRVFGGGGLSSRLYEEVREKRGLAYSVYAYLNPMAHSAVVAGGTATQNARAGESLDIIRAEWRKLAEKGISAKELAEAKDYTNGSFPLRLGSSRRIANTLVGVQLSGLDIGYLSRRAEIMNAVTLEVANRVARELFDADKLTVVVVGKPQGIAATP